MSIKAFKSVVSKAIRDGDLFGYWELQAGDTAAPLLVPRYSDKSVHIFTPAGGFWAGASISLVGGNDPDQVQFDTAYDYEGTAIVQSANAKPWVVLPNLYSLKPVLTGGDGTTLIRVAVFGRGGR